MEHLWWIFSHLASRLPANRVHHVRRRMPLPLRVKVKLSCGAEPAYLSLGWSGQLDLTELHRLVQSHVLVHLRQENRQNEDVTASSQLFMVTDEIHENTQWNENAVHSMNFSLVCNDRLLATVRNQSESSVGGVLVQTNSGEKNTCTTHISIKGNTWYLYH